LGKQRKRNTDGKGRYWRKVGKHQRETPEDSAFAYAQNSFMAI
jgi:hypothetical protein